MKKISIFLLTLLSVLCLVACGDEPTEEQVVEESKFSYHVVGGYLGDWNDYTEANKMTSITKDELAALDANMASQLEGKQITALMKFEGRVFNAGAGYKKPANVNGELVELDGGYSVKVVRAGFEEEDGELISYADLWIPDPKKAAVTNLTPAVLHMPKWVEKPAEGEEHLGTWADDPIVIGGAGEYTVVFAEFAGANSAETPKFAIGLIKTKVLEEPKTLEQLINEEYAGLKDKSIKAEDATEFEVTAEIVATNIFFNKKYNNYAVRLIVKLGKTLIGIYDGQIADADGKVGYPKTEDDIVGLEVGKTVTFKGKIAADYTLDIDDFHADIEFSKPVISWEVETYTKVTVAGIPAEATAVNAYWWGSADAVEWPGRAMTKNEDGTYSLDFPDHATGLIFNWTIGEASSQTVNLTPDKEKACWTLGTAGEDGKYPATNAKCYYDAITVDAAALIADLSDSLAESVTEVPAEYDIYVWFWGGSATGWFEAVNADGTFNVAAGCNGCTFLMAEKGATPAWETKLAQTGDYVIASGVATPKPAAE